MQGGGDHRGFCCAHKINFGAPVAACNERSARAARECGDRRRRTDVAGQTSQDRRRARVRSPVAQHLAPPINTMTRACTYSTCPGCHKHTRRSAERRNAGHSHSREQQAARTHRRPPTWCRCQARLGWPGTESGRGQTARDGDLMQIERAP